MTREVARREVESLDYYLQNHTDDYSEESHTAMMMAISALSSEPCREADDYENEIADLHNRLDIAEYDKERYKEEITILESENKEELTNEKAIAFLQDNGWLVEHDRIMTSGIENKGEWIPNKYNDHFHCDKCGYDIDLIGGVASNFCPNCGADMRGE